MERETQAYEVDDLDNSCGDEECCGEASPLWCVYLPVSGWRGYHWELARAERMARLCKRWGVL